MKSFGTKEQDMDKTLQIICGKRRSFKRIRRIIERIIECHRKDSTRPESKIVILWIIAGIDFKWRFKEIRKIKKGFLTFDILWRISVRYVWRYLNMFYENFQRRCLRVAIIKPLCAPKILSNIFANFTKPSPYFVTKGCHKLERLPLFNQRGKVFKARYWN